MNAKHVIWAVIAAVALYVAYELFFKRKAITVAVTKPVPPPAPNQSGQVASAFNSGLASAVGTGFNLLTSWASSALSPGASASGPAPVGSGNASTGVSSGITQSSSFTLTDPLSLFS